MKVQLFLAADYANMTREGKLNVMGIFTRINAPEFPARHPSLYLVMNLVAELGEFDQVRDIKIVLFDEDGKEQLSVVGKADFSSSNAPSAPEVSAALELRDIVFPKPGRYVFVLIVDKDHKASLSIQVDHTK